MPAIRVAALLLVLQVAAPAVRAATVPETEAAIDAFAAAWARRGRPRPTQPPSRPCSSQCSSAEAPLAAARARDRDASLRTRPAPRPPVSRLFLRFG